MDLAMIIGEEVKKATQNENDNENPQPDSKLMKLGRAAGVAGFQVFESLVKAGDRLMDEAVHETAQVVGHRYGKDASDLAREGMGIAKDVTGVGIVVGNKVVRRLASKGTMYTARGLIAGKP